MSGIIGFAMIHTMSYEKFKKYNYDGSVEYLPAKTLRCYKEEKFQKILSANGEEVMSRARYYTQDKVTSLDRIDGFDIINIEHLNMGVDYYVAYV